MPRTVHQGEATKHTPHSTGSLQRAKTEMKSQLDRNSEIVRNMCTMYKEGLVVIQELRAAREAIDERCRGAELRAEQLEHRMRDLMPTLGLPSTGTDDATASELSAFWCQMASSMDEKALSIDLKGSRWEMPKYMAHELPTLPTLPLPSLPPQLSLTQQAPQAILPARVLCHPDQPPQVHLTRPEYQHLGHQLQQPHQSQQQLQQGEQARQPQQPPQRPRSFLPEGRETARTGAQVQATTPTVKKRRSHEQPQPERLGRAERPGRTAQREATSPEFSPGSVSRRIAELEERAASAIRSRGRGDGCSSPKVRSPNHSPSTLRRNTSGCVRSPSGAFRSLRDSGHIGGRKEADQVTHVPSWSHLHGGGASGSSSGRRPHTAASGNVTRSGTPQSGRARGTQQHHDRQAHGVRAQSSTPQPRGSTHSGSGTWQNGRVPQSSSSASSLTSRATQSGNSVIRERIKALQAKGLTAAATGPRRWSPRDAILGGTGDPDELGRG